MIDAATKALTLQIYPMLGDLPASTLDELLASATYMKVPAQGMMFDENQPCMGFPLLLSGSARVIKAAPNGRELHLYYVLPGEACILTSSCLLGRANYQARCLVQQDLELVVLPPAAFRVLFSNLESFRDHVFSRFSERLSDLLQLVSAVTFQKLDQRLAAALTTRSSPIQSTHQALADELGSLREIVSRLLKNFADQGWVRLGRERIEVVDATALRRLADL
ncbi:Crp/Fnr family transcriptional regulator [Variovorax sp. HJSM1_2]|uniref:Crp/Fnr family transcriptional regulator n=1 Tax=Variovorax sp. HJSM1_2 TaxID=3366263 RepID=UPI003BDCA868